MWGLISRMDRESEPYRSGHRTGGTEERTQSVFGPDIMRIDRRRSVWSVQSVGVR